MIQDNEPDWFQWPPKLRGRGLYEHKYYDLLNKPQTEWLIDDWKLYAEFLLWRGEEIAKSLEMTMVLLAYKNRKSSRSKKPYPLDTSILDRVYGIQTKGFGFKKLMSERSNNRGRKPGSKHDGNIEKASALQKEFRSSGKKITDIEAARQVLDGAGLSAWAADRAAKNIAKRMSDRRKNSNNPKS